MSVCTIHLLRHAEHDLLGHTLAGRKAGVSLSDTGRAQAQSLATRYAGSNIRCILTSPVQRARQTAEPIAAALGMEPTVEPGLEELDFGRWSGQRFDTLDAEPGWAAWNTARGLAPTPGGETMLAAQARALTALMNLRGEAGTVVAVSHSDIIKAVLAHILGMPLDLIHRLDIAPASRSILVLGEDFARVEAINLPP